MGLLDNLKQQIGNQLGSQFIEIIQWLDDSADSLVYRFPVYNHGNMAKAVLIHHDHCVTEGLVRCDCK